MIQAVYHALESASFGCPFLCNSDGPGTPFATPLLIVSDIVRTMSVIAGFIIIVCTPVAIAKTTTRSQYARFIGLALFVVALTNSNAHHFGDNPNVGSVLGFAAIGFCLYGLMVYLREARQREGSSSRRLQH